MASVLWEFYQQQFVLLLQCKDLGFYSKGMIGLKIKTVFTAAVITTSSSSLVLFISDKLKIFLCSSSPCVALKVKLAKSGE